MPSTPTTIKAALESLDFSSLIGLDEDQWFEGKQRGAYALETPSGRYELAKDVCAFANSEGGYLLIGLKMDHLIEENTDRVRELDLCRNLEFDAGKYEGIISELIHPRCSDLRVSWIAQSSQPELGLGVIEIPVQPNERKFFLTAKVVEDDDRMREIVFGLSIRKKSASEPMAIEQLYTMMQKGKSPIAETLTRIEDKVGLLIRERETPLTPRESPSDGIARRIDRLFTES